VGTGLLEGRRQGGASARLFRGRTWARRVTANGHGRRSSDVASDRALRAAPKSEVRAEPDRDFRRIPPPAALERGGAARSGERDIAGARLSMAACRRIPPLARPLLALAPARRRARAGDSLGMRRKSRRIDVSADAFTASSARSHADGERVRRCCRLLKQAHVPGCALPPCEEILEQAHGPRLAPMRSRAQALRSQSRSLRSSLRAPKGRGNPEKLDRHG